MIRGGGGSRGNSYAKLYTIGTQVTKEGKKGEGRLLDMDRNRIIGKKEEGGTIKKKKNSSNGNGRV